MSPRVVRWLVGGGVAVSSGLLDVFLLGFVDPTTFNAQNLSMVAWVGAFFGLKAGLFYVKEHGHELAPPEGSVVNGWDRLAATVTAAMVQEDWKRIDFAGMTAQTPAEFVTLSLAEDFVGAQGGGKEKAAALREVVAECQRLRAHLVGAPQ